MKKYLLMDLGGTFVKYALGNEEGEFLEQGKIPSVVHDRDEFLMSIKPLFDKYKDEIEACAVSMPGRIDSRRGYAITAGAFGRIFKDFPVGDTFSEMLGKPVYVANDGKCAAAAELWKGALKGVENGIVIVLGSAIGGGLVINGKVYLGTNFAAGELSNFIFDGLKMAQDGFTIDYSKFTTDRMPFWMLYASARTLVNEYKMYKGMDMSANVSGEEVFANLRENEPEAVHAYNNLTHSMAAGILSLQTVLDVEKVAIGGGISAAPEVTEGIRKEVHGLFERNAWCLPCLEPEIVRCEYGNDANLIGALKLYYDAQ